MIYRWAGGGVEERKGRVGGKVRAPGAGGRQRFPR